MDDKSRSSVYSFFAPKPSAVQCTVAKLNEENIILLLLVLSYLFWYKTQR